MVRNVGTLDRGARIVVGILLLGLFGALPDPWKPFALLGLIFIATGVTGACPVYGLFGFSTRRARTRDAPPSPEVTPPVSRTADENTWPPQPAPQWRPWESRPEHRPTTTRGGSRVP